MSNEGPAGEFVKWLYGNVENARRALAEHLRGLKRPQPAPPLGIPEGDFLKRLPEEAAQRLREMAENTRRGWENIARRASALAEDMRRWPEEVKKYEELREGARGRGVPAPPIGVAVPPRPPEARPLPQPMPPPDYVLYRAQQPTSQQSETPQVKLGGGHRVEPVPPPPEPMPQIQKVGPFIPPKVVEPVPEQVETPTQVLPPPPPPPRPAPERSPTQAVAIDQIVRKPPPEPVQRAVATVGVLEESLPLHWPLLPPPPPPPKPVQKAAETVKAIEELPMPRAPLPEVKPARAPGPEVLPPPHMEEVKKLLREEAARAEKAPPPPPPKPTQKVTEPVQHMAQTMARAIEELPKVAPVATRPEVKTVQTQPRPVQLAQNVKARKAVALEF